jgi:polar amino acid transport system ATP-binding protein
VHPRGDPPGRVRGDARGCLVSDPAGDVVLQLRGVHKRFGTVEVLKGIDLTLDRHEVVCLIGASGSGKSTLLRCCNRLERIQQGSIEVLGTDLEDPRLDEDLVCRHIGIVFQSFNLSPI